jgi:hypothetical protein
MSQFVSSHLQLHLRNKEMQPWLEADSTNIRKLFLLDGLTKHQGWI